jgi:uncharacterized protein
MKLYRLKVHPDARKTQLKQLGPDAYEVWVRAPAERGLANDAVCNVLAEHLGVNPGQVRLIKGATSPSKIVSVLGS